MFFPVSQFEVNYSAISTASGVDLTSGADRVAKPRTLAHALVSLAYLKGWETGGIMPPVSQLVKETRLSEHVIFGALLLVKTQSDQMYIYENLGRLTLLQTYVSEVIYAYGSILDWMEVTNIIKADKPSKALLEMSEIIRQFLKTQGL